MPSEPSVSVVMPAYNRARFVRESIESVLLQTHRDLELIVIDDGSTDRTADVARRTGDPRVRVVENGRNLGVCATRNRGLDLARGEFVANLDSDDLAHPRRLEKQVAFLRRRPEVALVGSWARRIKRSGRDDGLYRRPCGPDRIRAQLLFRNCFKNTTVTARREVLLRHRYRESFHVNEDVDLHVRIALEHEVDNLPEALSSYRLHAGSLSREQAEATERAEERIASEQLERLGVEHDDDDLALHRRLRWRRQEAFSAEDLGRIESWLLRLAEANARSALYPEPDFARVLANRWWRACRFAAAPPAPARARRFARSPLARSALGAAFDAAATRLAGRGSW